MWPFAQRAFMACPHCGEHLVHKQAGLLRCCRCNRVRHDLGEPQLPLQGLVRHLPILLMAVFVLPVVFGMASLDAGRSGGWLRATAAQQAED